MGKTAEIASRDPVTGESISITITLDGVADVQPEGSVVSVVGAETDIKNANQEWTRMRRIPRQYIFPAGRPGCAERLGLTNYIGAFVDGANRS